MNVVGQPTLDIGSARGHDLETLRSSRLCLIVMGIVLMFLGAAAAWASFVATMATVMVFGILLVIAAMVQIASAFWGRQWRGFFLQVLAGVLYLIAGIIMIDHPLEAAFSLTLMVAACLFVVGVLRIVLALTERFGGWGWVLLNGVVSTGLGASIWRQWPLSGFWVIGLFFGIEIIFSGLSYVMLGCAVRPDSPATYLM